MPKRSTGRSTSAERHWLLKSEPSVFSFDDLVASPRRTTTWEGVRNYQARNLMREMTVGDRALFCHSGANPPAVVGTATIVRAAYPDDDQFDPKSRYFDPKSDPERPRWDRVDVRADRAFRRPVTLPELREVRSLAGMDLLRRGNRLSVQVIRPVEWRTITELGGL